MLIIYAANISFFLFDRILLLLLIYKIINMASNLAQWGRRLFIQKGLLLLEQGQYTGLDIFTREKGQI